jgi:hypothetical protein
VDADQQLGEREGLGQVVVAAGVEAAQPVGERVQRREEQHRHRDAARPQRLAHVAPVGVRQADVEHEHVGAPSENAARASVPDAVARTAKPSRSSAERSTPRSSSSSSQIPARAPVGIGDMLGGRFSASTPRVGCARTPAAG